MSAETVIGLCGIGILTAAVVAIVAVWRTGSPLPPRTEPPPLRPDCTNCGHDARSHGEQSGCAVTYGSGDIYDNGGDWIGHQSEHRCPCATYHAVPWPNCTTCGHRSDEHDIYLRCRHGRTPGSRHDDACSCTHYRSKPKPKRPSRLERRREKARRCRIPADRRADGALCLRCEVRDGRCRYDPPPQTAP